jgi:hypothetical protein
MDISRLCMAAAMLPLTTLTLASKQYAGDQRVTQQSRLMPQCQDIDLRQSAHGNHLSNIDSNPTPETTSELKGWEKTRDQDGIKIYTRTDPGKAFQRLKGEFEMVGSEDDAMTALMDPDHFIDWLDGMAEIKISDRTPNDQAFTLNAVSKEANFLLFTIPAREISIRCEQEDLPHKGGKRLTMNMLPKPTQKSKNRIYADAFEGEVTIAAKRNDQIGVSFDCYFEPGGQLPAWAVNSVSAGSVFKSMTNARHRIEATRDSHS